MFSTDSAVHDRQKVSSFAETSFLFALYFPNEDSAGAPEYVAQSVEPIILSRLVVYEFHQAVWFEVYCREHGDLAAVPREAAYAGLAAFELDLESGVLEIERTDFDDLLDEALRLVDAYTLREGLRSMDALHLAAAKLDGCTDFLSFDKVQRRVAELEGFSLPL
jgi:predicted nucleic acid-binding protein